MHVDYVAPNIGRAILHVCLSMRARQASELWQQGLQQGKNFLRSPWEWVRSGYKHSKFLDVMGPVQTLHKFLLEAPKIQGHVSFRLLCFRAEFFQSVQSDGETQVGSATKALQGLLDKGFAVTLASATAKPGESRRVGAQTSADAWLRTPLVLVFVDGLGVNAPEEDGPPECVAAVLQEVLSVKALLQERVQGTECLCDELGHFAAVLQCTACPDEAVAENVSASLEYFSVPAAQKLRAEVEATRGGAGLFLAAACFMQEIAKDMAGADKVDMAIGRLNDSRLPRLVLQPETNDQFNVVNFELFADSGVDSVLKESMSLVSEAMSLWSKAQLARQSAKLKEWSDLSYQKIMLYDLILSAGFAAYLGGPIINATLGDKTPDPEGANEVAVLEEVSDRLAGAAAFPDEAEWRKLVMRVHMFLKRLAGLGGGLAACDEAATDLSNRVVGNSMCRNRILEVINVVTSLPEGPADVKEIVEQWRMARGGENQVSFLDQGMDLLQAVEALRLVKFMPAGPADKNECGAANMLEFTMDDAQYSARALQMCGVQAWLCDMEVVCVVRDSVHGSLQEVFDQFVSSCQLTAVRAPTGSVVGGQIRHSRFPENGRRTQTVHVQSFCRQHIIHMPTSHIRNSSDRGACREGHAGPAGADGPGGASETGGAASWKIWCCPRHRWPM